MGKQQKKKKTDGESTVKRRRHKTSNRVAHQKKPDASDPAPKAIVARAKLDLCWNELNEKAKTLPTKSRVILIGNMQGIREGKPIRMPAIMPECDKTDIYNNLQWYRHLWAQWKPLADAVEKRYGTR